MTEKRFVRRRSSIPNQVSPVSQQEQARLLNDPAVPIEDVHPSVTNEFHEERGNDADGQLLKRNSRESLDREEAA